MGEIGVLELVILQSGEQQEVLKRRHRERTIG